MNAPSAAVSVWFYRHGKVPSHGGDVPLADTGLHDAEAAGARLATAVEPGARIEFRHAPTPRTLQTLQALRRGPLDASILKPTSTWESLALNTASATPTCTSRAHALRWSPPSPRSHNSFPTAR
jgi:Histidine phosphatase superfamily (branch 1)